MAARNTAYAVIGDVRTGGSNPVIPILDVTFIVLSPNGTIINAGTPASAEISYGDDWSDIKGNVAASIRLSQNDPTLAVVIIGGQ